MDTTFEKVIEAVLLALPRVGASILVFFVLWGAGLFAERVINRLGSRAAGSPEVIALLARTAKVVLVVIGLITALGTVGIDVSGLVAGLGLTGFAMGFALRDALSNVLAGILILSYRPFRHGDRIEVGGLQGVVRGVDLRYTTLYAEDKKILLPNATLFTNTVVVYLNGKAPG
ncbi:MAG TPA: mechanosensitive ion channel domain-containing protein [Candidatus Acidoferrales bacterium]|nr:mechanosensitive ion channel domain-containing protein [Candidatus Acidoferrales bacterium]